MRRPARAKRPKQQGNEAALIRRLGGALPLPSAQSSARVSAWLASIKANAAGKTLKSLIRAHPPLAKLLGGIAEAAPYLWDLVQADSARFVRLLDSDPDAAIAALVDGNEKRRRRGAVAGRRDARSPPHEGGSRAFDRARRYWRRLAGCARHRRADRCRGNRARCGRALSSPRGGQTQKARPAGSKQSRSG